MKAQCSGFIVIDEEQAHFEIIKRELCLSYLSVPKRAGLSGCTCLGGTGFLPGQSGKPLFFSDKEGVPLCLRFLIVSPLLISSFCYCTCGERL